MDLSILELFLNASIVVKSVIVILILASLVSWMIIFERWIYIKKVNQEFFNFETRFWSDSGLEALLLTSQEGEHEPIGAEYIFQVGYLDYKRLIAEKIDSDTIISSVQRNMQAALTKEQSLLEKHLPFLATIASVSPYIGLFGTVWGIMNSFRGLAGSSQATLSAVAPGISEALIATAIGLFAAIPALIAYNKYISDSDRLISSFEGFKEEFSSVLHRDMQSDKK
jgi:biopolymer transport protein TolQ